MAIFSSGSDKNALPAAPAAPSVPKSSRPSAASVAAAVHGGRPADALADYLFAQARESLQALHQHGYLPARDYQAIKTVMDNVQLNSPDPPVSSKSRSTGSKGDEEEGEEDIGKVNSWLRTTLEESSLIPTLVESALTSAAPFLSDTQVDAIMEIVEESQETLAKAVTNPSTHQMAKRGAVKASKGAVLGAKSGWQASSRSISGAVEKSKAQRQAKNKVKEEQRAVAAELAAEREWARKHAVERAPGSHPTLVSKSPEQRMHAERLVALEARDMALAQQVAAEAAQEEKEETGSRRVPPMPWELQTLAPASSSSDQDAFGGSFVSAQCVPLPEGEGAHSALTTTFSPWPGMVLSQSLVVSSGTKSDIRLAQQAKGPTRQTTQELVESPTTTLSSLPTASGTRSDSSSSIYKGPPPPPAPATVQAPAYTPKTSTSLPQPPPPPPPAYTQPPPRPPKTPPASHRSPQHPATSRSLPPNPAPPGAPKHPSTPATVPVRQTRDVPPAATGSVRPPPPRPSGGTVDETAPPPFGTVVDTTSSKRKGGWSRLLS